MSYKVAIIIPLYNRPYLTSSEKLSLHHLEEYLSPYDKYFIAPESLDFSIKGYKTIGFADHYFGSMKAHSALMISAELYNLFNDYDYLLYHHLDCLVFSDSLPEWCDREYDLIAPPWVMGSDLPWLKEEGVGTGGFSLRKISSFKRLLNSKVKWKGFGYHLKNCYHSKSVNDFFKKSMAFASSGFRKNNTIHDHLAYFLDNNGNEDRFLWLYATKYDPDFTIAPVEQALRFGFEANPKICFERNNFELPFGCHAWEKYDKKFWEPWLLKSFSGKRSGSKEKYQLR